MNDQYNDEDEEQRRRRRAERIAQMKREKERQEKINRLVRKGILYGGCALFVILALTVTILLCCRAGSKKETEESKQEEASKPKETGQAENDDTAGNEGTARSESRKEQYDRPLQEKDSEVWSFAGNVQKMAYTESEEAPIAQPPQVVDGHVQVGNAAFLAAFEANATAQTVSVGGQDVLSDHALLINESTNEIVAWKDAQVTINPASMTKILTILVAAEHVTDLDDKVTITIDVTDYAYVNDCSIVGFQEGDVVTVRDLFYGTILPSGADAALALAVYVAGSQEAFVELMNEKLEELGLSETAHFTNCVGLYDADHYCRMSDMAIILKAAVEDEWCREVLSAHIYTTSPTQEHPEGITISNWFLRRIEDKDTKGEVLCAKTGYVDQSRSCAASYYVSDSGVPYICVTAGAYSSWRCIYDHVAMYSLYAG